MKPTNKTIVEKRHNGLKSEREEYVITKQIYTASIEVDTNLDILAEMEEAVQKLSKSYSLSELIYLTQIFFNQKQ